MEEHYFEMSKSDAERALRIYRTFAKQTDQVVSFLSVARQFEGATRLAIPKLKHAPTGLTSSLEEYLNDPDFEVNRRQYLAQKEAKRSGNTSASKEISTEFSKLSTNGSTSKSQSTTTAPSAASQSQVQHTPQVKGPAPDLIDFFDSIEQNQQPMVIAPQHMGNGNSTPQYGFQQPGVVPGQMPQAVMYGATNPFANMVNQPQQQNPGFNPQQQQQQQVFSPTQLTSIPQNTSMTFQPQPFGEGHQQQSSFNGGLQQFTTQPQFNNTGQSFFDPNQQPFSPTYQSPPSLQPNMTGTNPFRTSMISQQPTSTSLSSFPPPIQNAPSQQSTNPFRSSTLPPNVSVSSAFTSAPPSATQSFFSSIQSPQSPQSFSLAQNSLGQQPLQPTRTGTNPFKSAPSSTFHTPLTSPIAPQQTGTNPFRQSAYVNQQTGQGWQANQGTIGGLEQLETIPIFPRPAAQPQPWP